MNTNDQDFKLASARFKRDHVAWLAIIFFFAIVVMELIVAASIPILVKNETVWAKQVARQDMSTMFDNMRNSLRKGSGSKDRRVAGESKLLLNILDDQAIYLRKNHEQLTKRQIAEFDEELRKIAAIQSKLGAEKAVPFSTQLEIDASKFWEIMNEKMKTEKE
ncbi:MAG: hypothetical protein PHS31_10100 [Victivallaceae bacterium]|nr:hypothetical protein [Victivallaceae bacterium]MDD4180394.1 hypothetical protein [Victivallaceae bacterium]